MITGAAHGIGYSFALEAVRRGMKLALVDIDAPALEAVAAECREMGAEVLTCETDVSVYEEAKASVQATMDRYGQIDVLFCKRGDCHGGQYPAHSHPGLGVGAGREHHGNRPLCP